jgi:hypothetical protein
VKICERQGHRRQRMKEPYQPVADVGQLVPATENIDAVYPGQANLTMSGYRQSLRIGES